MSLVHHRRGGGEPLLLVHGTGSRRQVWDPVVQRLSAERDVIAMDLPGFGESQPLPEPVVTPERYALAIGELLDELGLASAHVAGNSLGGGIALVLGASGRARSVTALSPIGFWTDKEADFCRRSLRASAAVSRALAPVEPLLLDSAAGRTLTMGQFFAHPARVPARDAVESARALAECPGLHAALDGYRRWRFVPDGPLPCPVTIAWAEKDRLLLPRQAARARRAVPGAHHVTLRDCGHVPVWDDPEQVACVLLAGSATQEAHRRGLPADT